MKTTLHPGLSFTRRVVVDEARAIAFMGREGMVYATPWMVSDVEYACRDFLLAHLDTGEDSVGVHVTIEHLAATPIGMSATVQARVARIEGRRVTFEFHVRDELEECGRGTHVRVVVDAARTRARVAAKRAQAAAGKP